MAVTINATTTQGLLVTPDNSGQIQFQLNGVNVPSPSTVPVFSAYQSGNINISNNTSTKVQLNNKEFDTANCFDTSAYRYTPNVAGYYQINCDINLNNSAGASPTNSYTQLYKNGSLYKQSSYYIYGGGTMVMQLPLSAIVYLNGSTDYVELYAYISTTGTPCMYGGQYNTFMQGILVRAG